MLKMRQIFQGNSSYKCQASPSPYAELTVVLLGYNPKDITD